MKAKTFFYSTVSIGAPLTLAVLEIFHPHPHDLFQLDLRTWLIVHYLQIPLFPLSALAVVMLLRGLPGIAACFARVAMFIFAIVFVAFDTAAGVVTGILLQAAKSTSAPEQWQPAVMAVWRHPVMGGAPGTSPLLAILGSVAWSLGTTAAAWVVWRRRDSLVAAILLVVSGLGLSIFKTHAWPGGPVSFGALSLAAAWLQWQSVDASHSDA
jgi:hypothetical protein